MGTDRVMAEKWEVAGYGPLPGPRNIAHAHPQWYELDLDDPIEDPDEPWLDPLPTERHRQVP